MTDKIDRETNLWIERGKIRKELEEWHTNSEFKRNKHPDYGKRLLERKNRNTTELRKLGFLHSPKSKPEILDPNDPDEDVQAKLLTNSFFDMQRLEQQDKQIAKQNKLQEEKKHSEVMANLEARLKELQKDDKVSQASVHTTSVSSFAPHSDSQRKVSNTESDKKHTVVDSSHRVLSPPAPNRNGTPEEKKRYWELMGKKSRDKYAQNQDGIRKSLQQVRNTIQGLTQEKNELRDLKSSVSQNTSRSQPNHPIQSTSILSVPTTGERKMSADKKQAELTQTPKPIASSASSPSSSSSPTSSSTVEEKPKLEFERLVEDFKKGPQIYYQPLDEYRRSSEGDAPFVPNLTIEEEEDFMLDGEQNDERSSSLSPDLMSTPSLSDTSTTPASLTSPSIASLAPSNTNPKTEEKKSNVKSEEDINYDTLLKYIQNEATPRRDMAYKLLPPSQDLEKDEVAKGLSTLLDKIKDLMDGDFEQGVDEKLTKAKKYQENHRQLLIQVAELNKYISQHYKTSEYFSKYCASEMTANPVHSASLVDSKNISQSGLHTSPSPSAPTGGNGVSAPPLLSTSEVKFSTTSSSNPTNLYPPLSTTSTSSTISQPGLPPLTSPTHPNSSSFPPGINPSWDGNSMPSTSAPGVYPSSFAPPSIASGDIGENDGPEYDPIDYPDLYRGSTQSRDNPVPYASSNQGGTGQPQPSAFPPAPGAPSPGISEQKSPTGPGASRFSGAPSDPPVPSLPTSAEIAAKGADSISTPRSVVSSSSSDSYSRITRKTIAATAPRTKQDQDRQIAQALGHSIATLENDLRKGGASADEIKSKVKTAMDESIKSSKKLTKLNEADSERLIKLGRDDELKSLGITTMIPFQGSSPAPIVPSSPTRPTTTASPSPGGASGGPQSWHASRTAPYDEARVRQELTEHFKNHRGYNQLDDFSKYQANEGFKRVVDDLLRKANSEANGKSDPDKAKIYKSALIEGEKQIQDVINEEAHKASPPASAPNPW